jgi:hypothetical protein
LENSENSNEKNGVSDTMDVDQEPTKDVDKTAETMDVDEGPSNMTKDLKLKSILSNVEDSRPGTPLEGSFLPTPTSSQTPQSINPCVRILAKAVLEVPHILLLICLSFLRIFHILSAHLVLLSFTERILY